jgi:hypothetical protein
MKNFTWRRRKQTEGNVIEQWWKNTEKILLFYSNLYKVVKA